MYYKLVGKEFQPISIMEWIDSYGVNPICRWSNGKVYVSTVFLGMDHGIPSDPLRPVLFETLVMGGILDGSMGRYPTYDLAIKGHKEWINLVRGKYCVWSIIKGERVGY